MIQLPHDNASIDHISYAHLREHRYVNHLVFNEALAKSRNGDKSGVKKIFQKLQSDWAVNHQGEKMPDNMMIPVPGVYRSSNSSASISNLKGDSLWMYGDPETDSYDFIEPKHHK